MAKYCSALFKSFLQLCSVDSGTWFLQVNFEQFTNTKSNQPAWDGGSIGATLDVNSISNPLPPPLPIPRLLTDGQTRKKQAHRWTPIRRPGRKELQWDRTSTGFQSFVSLHQDEQTLTKAEESQQTDDVS